MTREPREETVNPETDPPHAVPHVFPRLVTSPPNPLRPKASEPEVRRRGGDVRSRRGDEPNGEGDGRSECETLRQRDEGTG